MLKTYQLIIMGHLKYYSYLFDFFIYIRNGANSMLPTKLRH